ncbi:MAG: hypothetical protein JHD16_13600 [Solirubrobacteraceae bacterium]|nr:hypothetical protein [Solirubrobacteraceae bacterium]
MVAALALLALPGCTTTQERSAKMAENSETAAEAKRFNVGKTNPDVTAKDVTWIEGEGVGAVVVRVVNSSGSAQASVPIGLDLYTADKTSLYTNRIDGLEPALNMLPLAPPGESWWVHNQLPADKPARERVRIGTSKVAPPKDIPRIDASEVTLGDDGGIPTGRGKITNRSEVEQQRITVFAVALKGDRIVAAGRSVVERLQAASAKKPEKFAIYFNGDPRGADIRVFVPPSTLGDA